MPTCLRGMIVMLLAATAHVFAAQADDPNDPATRFAYDTSRPLELQDRGSEIRDEAVIRDVTFTGADRPVTAYLVEPQQPHGPLAAILYVHWLGDQETTNRTEFLKEAVALAGQGVVSLLVDAMWSRPKWYDSRIPEEDTANGIKQVIDLRRALDLLLAQPHVDQNRVALVGHDFGAIFGVVMGAVDARPSTYVLMAGTPQMVDWMLFARQPKSPEDYRRELATLDPIAFVPKLAPASVFFQFASRDEYVPAEAAAKFYAAALPRKQMALYDAGHDLQKADVTADRISWLMRTLRLQR